MLKILKQKTLFSSLSQLIMVVINIAPLLVDPFWVSAAVHRHLGTPFHDMSAQHLSAARFTCHQLQDLYAVP